MTGCHEAAAWNLRMQPGAAANRRSSRFRIVLATVSLLLCLFAFLSRGPARITAAEPSRTARATPWVLVVAGLPGDEERAAAQRQTLTVWRRWFVDRLRIPPEQIVFLPNVVQADVKSPTAAQIRDAMTAIAGKSHPDDQFWLFTLGHGNYDGKTAFFHVAEKDPASQDFARWLDEIPCRTQFACLTHSSSGWMLKPLARPGRIVVTGSAADDEYNETEFPAAFAAVIAKPQTEIDLDQDGRASIAELFAAVGREVERRFKAEQLVATEHGQLDDTGDGRGVEAEELAKRLETAGEVRQTKAVAPAESPLSVVSKLLTPLTGSTTPALAPETSGSTGSAAPPARDGDFASAVLLPVAVKVEKAAGEAVEKSPPSQSSSR